VVQVPTINEVAFGMTVSTRAEMEGARRRLALLLVVVCSAPA